MGEDKRIQCYRCPKCGWTDFFESKTCPQCLRRPNMVELSGRGTIASFTLIRYPPKGFEKDAPYIVGLVDLEDGLRVIGRIKGNPTCLNPGQVVQYTGKISGALWFEA
jgi:uncharacterized OB-fold protein